MGSARSWQSTALVYVLLVSLVLAGCLGGSDVRNPGGTGMDVHDETELGDESARERALSAEEAFITQQLENAPCVEGWGLTEYGGIAKDAVIENRTADGVYVEVTHPYWYGTEQDEVDGGTTARYLVTAENVQRIDGDKLNPC